MPKDSDKRSQPDSTKFKFVLSAASTDGKDFVQMMLDKYVSVNAGGSNGDTDLPLAAIHNYAKILKELLEKGANENPTFQLIPCNAQPPVAQKAIIHPLIELVEEGNTERLAAFLKSNAALNTIDEDLQFGALQSAVHNDHIECLKQLCAVFNNPNAQSYLYKRTALHWAAKLGRIEHVKILLEHGAKVDQANGSGVTALHLAATHGHKDCVQFLFEHGAEVNAQCNRESTALSMAVGNIECVKFLLEHGAKVNVQDIYGYTPLHEAAIRGHFDSVKALLKKGADLNTRNDRGRTPLHCAAMIANRSGSKEIEIKRTKCVNALLERDAKILLVEDKFRFTALYYAVINKASKDCIQALLKKDPALAELWSYFSKEPYKAKWTDALSKQCFKEHPQKTEIANEFFSNSDTENEILIILRLSPDLVYDYTDANRQFITFVVEICDQMLHQKTRSSQSMHFLKKIALRRKEMYAGFFKPNKEGVAQQEQAKKAEITDKPSNKVSAN
jgi:ankyrin repeat protein